MEKFFLKMAETCLCSRTQMFSLSFSLLRHSHGNKLYHALCIIIRGIVINKVVVGSVQFLRKTNLLGEGSCCRGGIVNSECTCCSRALAIRRPRLSLSLFSISNSPSGGRTRLHAHTPTCHIYHTYAQQGIRVCGADPFQPPNRRAERGR